MAQYPKLAGSFDEVARFHVELRALWVRAGKADAWTLGKRTGLPSARFEFLFRPDADEVLPEWSDVKALLVAAAEPATACRSWEARWGLLNNAVQGVALEDVRLPGRGRRPPRPQWPDEHEASEIRKLVDVALEARDPLVFVTQLEKLRQLQGKSFAVIEKASTTMIPQKDKKPRVERLARSTAHRMVQPGNFPTHARDVRMFVRACGVGSEEMVEKWVLAYTRAAQRRQAQSVFEKTRAHHADLDQASVVEEAVDQLATQGAYFEAIRMLKAAYREERARRQELEGLLSTSPDPVQLARAWAEEAKGA